MNWLDPHTYCTPSSSVANFHNDESQHDNFEDEEYSEEDQDADELLSKFTKKNGKKNKTGRKAQWTDSLLSDMIDIVVSGEYYKKKLIFTNTKNQKNGAIYGNVLEELKTHASARNETVPFTAVQPRNKFKKAVAEGQVNNADHADPADLAILVRDIKVRVIQFDLGETE